MRQTLLRRYSSTNQDDGACTRNTSAHEIPRKFLFCCTARQSKVVDGISFSPWLNSMISLECDPERIRYSARIPVFLPRSSTLIFKSMAELKLSKEDKAFIEKEATFKALPFVKRVVFISTPHRGSFRQKIGSTLQGMKNRLLEMYRKCLGNLETIASCDAFVTKFVQAIETAPADSKKIRKSKGPRGCFAT